MKACEVCGIADKDVQEIVAEHGDTKIVVHAHEKCASESL